MQRLIIILFITLFMVETGKAQKDSAAFKHWEIGVESDWNLLFYNYEWDPYGPGPDHLDWVYCFTDAGYSRNDIDFGLYFKYRLLNFLSLNAGVNCRHFKGGSFSESQSWVRYQDSLLDTPLYDYEFRSIEFPVCLTVSFLNRFFINPYLSAGFTNNICIFEKALIDNDGFKFYKNRQWKYYSFRLRYGGGIDFTICRQVRLGCEVYLTTRPVWQTYKVMVTGIRYSNFSVGFHAGYLLK
jgi:hypothetical protein